ncbi:MAG: tRNA 2-selenouridine(34) synthase MnmH [Bacteroidia bacterium]|nr:tRNA 2-selenouridine(34) synthase MnmH [Bacteroidia bacterium]
MTSKLQAPKIDIKSFLSESEGFPLIDVRSPAEFALGHIPDAQNIPLFDDHERAEIGTLYKMRGKEEAVERGLEIVSPKLALFVRAAKQISAEKKVFVYCWRGGMRSNSFAWLMNTAGLNSTVLEGGYKTFRNHVLSYFDNKFELVLIGGPTGSGKTAILKELEKKGEQILDLEKIARHKGSAFGSVNELPQLPQQQFEHGLFLELKKLDLTKTIWTEDEAFSIGRNKIPFALWKQMKQAPILKIEVPFQVRVNRLVEDYRTTDTELLKKPILAIQKRLGGLATKEALEFLEKGELDKVAALALVYYDEAYQHDHNKREMKNIFLVETETGDPLENATKILQMKKSLSIS